MLVFSRKRGEEIVIGDGIRVTVLEMRGNQVKLGFVAPAEATIFRKEIQQAVEGSRPVLALRPAQVAGRFARSAFLPRLIEVMSVLEMTFCTRAGIEKRILTGIYEKGPPRMCPAGRACFHSLKVVVAVHAVKSGLTGGSTS